MGALCAVEGICFGGLFLQLRLRGVGVGVWHVGGAAVGAGVLGVREVQDEGAGCGEDNVAGWCDRVLVWGSLGDKFQVELRGGVQERGWG
jgi:hypothetical protein